MTSRKPLLYAALAIFLFGGPAWADHWHDDHKHWNKHAKQHGDEDEDNDVDHHARGCFFQPRDVRVITEYYEPEYRRLPPGLEKKNYRTGQLPPGWQKKIQSFPVVVEQQLVVLPPGYRRGIIDGYAVVYKPRTQIIIDITAVFGR